MKKLNKRRDVLRVTVPTEAKGVIVPCGREKREVQMGKERFGRAVKGCSGPPINSQRCGSMGSLVRAVLLPTVAL